MKRKRGEWWVELVKLDYCTVHFGTCCTYGKQKKRGKAIPVIGRGGPQGCETSSLPQFVDSRLTDGGEDVNLTL
jgi:hypothetical protein